MGVRIRIIQTIALLKLFGTLGRFYVTRTSEENIKLEMVKKNPQRVKNKNRIKITESEILDLHRQQTEIWNKNMRVILIILRALGTVRNNIVKKAGGWRSEEELRHLTTAWRRLAKILGNVLKNGGDLLSVKHQWFLCIKKSCLWEKSLHLPSYIVGYL